MRGRVRTCLVLALLAGCTTKRTEVVIGVATNLDAPSQMSTVHMTVSREGVPLIDQIWNLPGIPAGQFELPGSFGLFTDDGSEPRITVELVGIIGNDDIIHRRSVFALVREQTLFLRMTLTDVCIHRTDCSAAETCIEGHCVPAEIDAHLFPAYVSGMENTISCSSGIVYKNTNTKQPMPMMGGGCAANELCSEGTCLKNPSGGGDGGIPDGGTPDGSTGGPVRFAYASISTLNQIQIFTVNQQTGDLTAAAPPSVAANNPGQLLVDPSNQFLLVTNNSGGQLASYRINATTGTPSLIGAIPVGTNPISLVIHPAGFVYTTNVNSNNVSIATLNGTTGALAFVGNATVGGNPQSVTTDPAGKNLYVANTRDGTVSTFSINAQTGALTAVGTPVATGTAPTFVFVDPAGRFVYTANSSASSVSTFVRDTATGALTAGATIPAGMTARSLVIDPTGRFAYVADFGSSQVSMFTVNAQTGAWTPLGTPIGVLAQPFYITVDPAGKHVYCANQMPGVIRPLTIDTQTGMLSLNQAIATGGGTPVAVTFAR